MASSLFLFMFCLHLNDTHGRMLPDDVPRTVKGKATK
jgi:hypothetical protein